MLVLNAPTGYPDSLGDLPERVTIATSGSGTFDFVLFFATNRVDITKLAKKAVQHTKTGGVLWLAYPKKTSGVESDLQRESTWETMSDATGWRPVSQIALDNIWSALRFRPQVEVKSRNTRFMR